VVAVAVDHQRGHVELRQVGAEVVAENAAMASHEFWWRTCLAALCRRGDRPGQWKNQAAVGAGAG